MKTPNTLCAMISAFLAIILVGCEKRDDVVPEAVSPSCGILSAIDELPKRLGSRKWRETGRFAYSNICCAVRKIDDKDERIRYSVAYTNKVLGIMPTPVDVRTSERLEEWRINVENYIDLVRWGYALLNDNMPTDVGIWDFLLGPAFLIRQEIDFHKTWLISQGKDKRRVEKDYYVRMLGDLIYNYQREISVCWYPSAKRRMSASQLAEVRSKIKAALGTLPPEMEKDERETASCGRRENED